MKTLIIKLGAMGDVLRTTSLLRVLDGEIYWITKENALPLLDNNPKIHKLTTDINDLRDIEFDVVYNLDDDDESCEFLNKLKFKELRGYYKKEGKILATETVKEWWEMGFHGLPEKDDLKKANTLPMQHFLFKIAGKEFNGEEYVFNFSDYEVDDKLIGLETNAGKVWPMKKWTKYDELAAELQNRGYKVKIFQQRDDLKDYIKDIAECSKIVTGDTLTMHIALALKKPTVAIFGPTSFHEIYDYGRMKKVVTSMDCVCCYKRQCDIKPSCMDNISTQEVLSALLP